MCISRPTNRPTDRHSHREVSHAIILVGRRVTQIIANLKQSSRLDTELGWFAMNTVGSRGIYSGPPEKSPPL